MKISEVIRKFEKMNDSEKRKDEAIRRLIIDKEEYISALRRLTWEQAIKIKKQFGMK